MKLKLLLIALALTCGANAQQLPTFSWAKNFGGTNDDNVVDMVVDNNGNSIVTGTFKNAVNFSAQVSYTSLMSSATQYSTDVFVAKYDANGNLLWAKTLGGNSFDAAAAVEVDPNGNVYVLADFPDSIDYDNAPGNQTFIAQPGLSDIILLKYNANGALLWAKQIGGPSQDKAADLDIDGNNNLIVTGSFFGTADFDPSPAFDTLTYVTNGPCSFQSPCTPDIFIAKYDSNGNHIWAKQAGGVGNDNPKNVACDSKNNIYISGIFNNTCDFNLNTSSPQVLTSVGSTDAYVAKYNTNGNFIWAKQLGNVGYAAINDLKFDNNDNFAIIGGFQGATDFDWGTDTTILNAPLGSSNIFFAKYDSSANFMWVKNMEHLNATGQDYGNSICFDEGNNVYVTGYFYGQNCDFDPDANSTLLLSSQASNNNEAFVGKYSSNGSLQWAHSIGDAGAEYGVTVKVANDNSLYLATNLSSSNVAYDFVTNTAAGNLSTNGSSDFTISKYIQCNVNVGIVQNGNTLTSFANNAVLQWLNCDVGFVAINGASAANFTPTVSGNYACSVAQGSCIDTTVCINVNLCANFSAQISTSGNAILSATPAGATYQWLNCNVGYAPIAGATLQTFAPTANGNYACKISSATCTDTSDCKLIDNVAVQDIADEIIVKFFPNPANDFVFITTYNNIQNFKVVIFDALGKVWKANTSIQNNQLKLDVKCLPAGIYIIKCSNGINNKVTFQKLIKE